jgi:hypothetical protein
MNEMNMSSEETTMAQVGIRVRLGRMASVVLVTFTCLGLSSGGVMAQKSKASENTLEVFDRNNFDRSTEVDNKWLPLRPGTQWVYKGFTQEDKKRVPVRVVQTVTDLTKVINGVRAVVVWDVDYKEGKVQESEIIFLAQDKDGNVWLLGELRETYDDAEFVGGRAWIAGLEGSSAGIMMKADPRPGTPSYSQGYAPPPFNWADRAVVERVGQKVCVPAGCYNDVLVIAESSRKEGPDAQQLKYYAPGVGYVRVGWRGRGEKLRETLELNEIVKLTPDALAKARAEALEIEKRAYLYGRTPSAELMKSATTAGGQ